jgi:riboflavin kinase/FMN adenylyltransferase
VPLGPRTHPALTYIGTRPTFDGPQAQPSVEVHIIDLAAADLYGERLEVQFLQWLRPDARFADAAALIAQMQADRDAALAVFAAHKAEKSQA